MSVRVGLITWLLSRNVHRAECRAMLEKFDELYPAQARACEPEDQLYEHLKEPT